MAPNFQWKFSQINITNNSFSFCQGLVYIDISNLTIDNSVFALNGDSVANANMGMLMIKVSDGYQISLVNNTFSDIYTNAFAAVYFI